jgi:hypothetical protein
VSTQEKLSATKKLFQFPLVVQAEQLSIDSKQEVHLKLHQTHVIPSVVYPNPDKQV